MENRKLKVALSLLAVLAVAAMIFFFSAQEGEESSEMSGRVTRFIAGLVIPGFDRMDAGEQQRIIDAWGLYIRKAAHFSEFALLGLALMNYLRLVAPGGVRRGIVPAAWIAAALYACTDEVHQMFVSDRGPAILDVGIDAAGALCGVLIAYFGLKWLDRRRKSVAGGGM